MEHITEHTFTGPARPRGAHTSFYLAAGPPNGTVLMLVHGWPELSLSWSKVMIPLAQHGFRCIAPDMRGYGKSTVYSDKDAYTHEEIARDLLELLDHLGREKAVWIGHDHGSPAVGNLVAHYPSRVLAAAFLCVPYLPRTMELQTLEPLIDRSLYPADVYPYGQWEYQAHHYEKFEETVQYMDADPGKMVRLLFRRGSPRAIGKVAAFAKVRRDGGFFGGIALKDVPDVPLDTSVLSQEEYRTLSSSLARTGFHGPNAWYANLPADREWTGSAVNSGRLEFPVLFIHARYDVVCASLGTKLADPMRASCPNLTEAVVDAGHWVTFEKPGETADAILRWMGEKLPGLEKGRL